MKNMCHLQTKQDQTKNAFATDCDGGKSLVKKKKSNILEQLKWEQNATKKPNKETRLSCTPIKHWRFALFIVGFSGRFVMVRYANRLCHFQLASAVCHPSLLLHVTFVRFSLNQSSFLSFLVCGRTVYTSCIF